MKFAINWFWALVGLLSDQRGDNTIVVDALEEGIDGEEGEGEGEGTQTEDASADGEGEGGGKDREGYIPRERFDKVNDRAKRVDALVDLGILEEDESGELRLNPKHGKATKEEGSGEPLGRDSFLFKKEDVDENSWPLVEKINKGFDHYEGLAQRMAFMLGQLRSENAIIRDYPEFIQKNSPIRKKAMDIMKNDPEFKKKYRGDPERSYWAVKRAVESLSGNPKGPKPKKKPNSSFITPRGDGGKTVAKRVDISTLSKEQLDELERKENDRINDLREKK